jgi:hypothetical protein
MKTSFAGKKANHLRYSSQPKFEPHLHRPIASLLSIRSADPERTLLFDLSNHLSALLLSPELPVLFGAAGRADKLEPRFARLLNGVLPRGRW